MSGQQHPSRSDCQPPVFVAGGKRLNFDRCDPYDGTVGDTFIGSGKADGCAPSCSWEELCAMAKLIVEHPAFRLPDEPNPHYPPRIADV